MSNQLSALIAAWKKDPDQDWVLGTVYKTEGSAYRKAGAMMLINGLGQQFGLLSGGCLEADVIRHARMSMRDGQSRLLSYDGSDEDDWSFQLGIGCGGKVFIMLQPLSQENDLDLGKIAAVLEQRDSGIYHQKIGATQAYFEPEGHSNQTRSVIETREDGDWLVTVICPEPHLLVVGGGVDARPVVAIAGELGWRVTLVDPRSVNARAVYFPQADIILRKLDDGLRDYIRVQRVDAAVIMTHNLDLDARALLYCQGSDLKHVAVLGPRHRYIRVLKRASLSKQHLTFPVSAPAGLDIGGRLPESIALSILSECHAVIHRSQSLPNQHLAAV